MKPFCSSQTRNLGLWRHDLPQCLQPAYRTSLLRAADLRGPQPPGSPLSPLQGSASRKPEQEPGATVMCWSCSPELTMCSPPQLHVQKHHLGSWDRPWCEYLHHKKWADTTNQGSSPQGAYSEAFTNTPLAVLLDCRPRLLAGAPTSSRNPLRPLSSPGLGALTALWGACMSLADCPHPCPHFVSALCSKVFSHLCLACRQFAPGTLTQ